MDGQYGLVAQVFVFLGIIANLVYQWLSDDRKYRREKEWEERTRQFNTDLARGIENKAADVAAVVAVKADRVEAKLDANTEISIKAFKEANDVNNKIANLGLAIPPTKDPS